MIHSINWKQQQILIIWDCKKKGNVRARHTYKVKDTG